MGTLRTIRGFTRYGATDTWQKMVPDIEARIQTLTVDSVTWTEQTTGILTIPPLEENKYYLDRRNKILYINVGNGLDANDKIIQVKTFFETFGEWATQAEINNNQLFQVFNLNSTNNFTLRYVKIPLMVLGTVSITSAKIELQSVRSGLPTGVVLAESESALTTIDWSADKLFTVFFKFDNYGLINNTDYAIVLKLTGTFNETNHVAWCKLDHLYTTGISDDLSAITEGGNRFALIGLRI